MFKTKNTKRIETLEEAVKCIVSTSAKEAMLDIETSDFIMKEITKLKEQMIIMESNYFGIFKALEGARIIEITEVKGTVQ